jgi:integrase/recombinase XerD
MTTSQVLSSRPPDSHLLQLAVAGYLARFKGISRTHAESDLRAYLAWCADRQLDPLAAVRPQVELYVRCMQEIRRLQPSTVSRRMSIVAGFHRTAVIDDLLEHSPAATHGTHGTQVDVSLPLVMGWSRGAGRYPSRGSRSRRGR